MRLVRRVSNLESRKAIAKKVVQAFGGTPKVNRYNSDDNSLSIDLINCQNQPDEHVNSYGTVGLSEYPLIKDGQEFHVRIELVGAAESTYGKYPNLLKSAAFYIINEHWFCCPGAILCNIIDMYDPNLEMKHFFFTTPFLWNELRETKINELNITWLLAVPISENEKKYKDEFGENALEEKFEEAQIDIFDISRPSII